ncbi:hypothetical protein [Microbacterium sp. YY-01]|uniref:hypothetical protein n=1 Tax=Microbacterium sp. YY-01 TaxID=3421634 RepID=UPI003D16E7EF
MNIRKGSRIVAAVAAALVLGSAPFGAVADEGPDASTQGTCVDVAKLAAQHAEIEPHETIQFLCFGNQVVVTADAGTPNEERAQVEVRFSDESTSSRNVTSHPADPEDSASTEPLAVPYSAASMAVVCDGSVTRTIKSELHELIYGCAAYGEYNTSNGAIIWQRTIDWEWNMYPGRPSAQNLFKIIPSAGSPTMSGSFTSRKQNWIYTPIELDRVPFSNASFATTTTWTGEMTEEGSHSVLIDNIRIVDSAKGFSGNFDGGIPSHRFTCSVSQNRCYFPNGQEAPL